MSDLGLGADPTGSGGDTNIVLKSHDVTSCDSILRLLDRGEGGGSREDWENVEDEGDELLGEHGSCSELWGDGFSE